MDRIAEEYNFVDAPVVEETKPVPVPKPVKRSYHSVKMGLGLWGVILFIFILGLWQSHWVMPNKVWIGGMIAIVIFNFVLYFSDKSDGPKGY